MKRVVVMVLMSCLLVGCGSKQAEIKTVEPDKAIQFAEEQQEETASKESGTLEVTIEQSNDTVVAVSKEEKKEIVSTTESDTLVPKKIVVNIRSYTGGVAGMEYGIWKSEEHPCEQGTKLFATATGLISVAFVDNESVTLDYSDLVYSQENEVKEGTVKLKVGDTADFITGNTCGVEVQLLVE